MKLVPRLAIVVLALFLVPVVPTVPAEAEGPTVTFTDGTGDVTAEPSSVPGDKAPPIIDIRRFAVVSEDEFEFVVELETAPWTETTRYANSVGYVSVDLVIRFEFGDMAKYRLSRFMYALRYADDPNTYAFYDYSGYSPQFAMWAVSVDVNRAGAGYSFASGDSDAEKGLMRVHVRKPDLRPLYTPAGAEPNKKALLPITVGSQLTNFFVEANSTERVFGLGSSNSVPPVMFHDWAPDAGPSTAVHTIQKGFVNTDLRVTSDGGFRLDGLRNRYYQPGLNQSFPFRVSNVEGPRKLVRLTYDFMDPSMASRFAIHGPGTVSIPSGETRTYSFSFKSPDEIVDPTLIRIRAQSVGATDFGEAMLWMQNGTILDPVHNKLSLFGKTYPQTSPTPCVPHCWSSPLLTARASVPGFERNGRVPIFNGPVDMRYSTRLDNPLGGPAALSRSSDIIFDVGIAATYADEEEVDVRVLLGFIAENATGGNAAVVLDVTKTMPVPQAGTTFQVKAKSRLPYEVLPAGGTFTFQIGTKINKGPGAPPSGQPLQVETFGALPKDTQITLPLVELPPELKQTAVASPFQVALRAGQDPFEFVNPGKARLFNVTILNYDSQEQRLQLSAQPTRPWPVEVLPATKFDLAAGQAITTGVLVRSPVGTPDNEAVDVWINATSDSGAVVGLKIHVTNVAGGAEFADDTGRFKASEEDLEAAVTPAKKSPANGLFVALGALLLAGRGRRRRAA